MTPTARAHATCSQLRIRITEPRVATATLSLAAQDEVHMVLEMHSTHRSPRTRRRFIGNVLAHPEVRTRHRIRAVMPIAEPDLIDLLVERCHDVRVRTVGSACLIDARR